MLLPPLVTQVRQSKEIEMLKNMQSVLKQRGRGMMKVLNQKSGKAERLNTAPGVSDGGQGPRSGRGYKKRKSIDVY